MRFAAYVLYATRELSLSPALLGLVYAAGGVGGVGGALLAGPATRRFGLGRALVGASVVTELGNLFVPLAAGPRVVAVALLVAGQAVSGLGDPIYNVTVASLRQAITPDRPHGRVVASMRLLSAGAMPIGALIGGLLGETIGLRPTLVVAAVGPLLAPVVLAMSPVRVLREPPPPIAPPDPSNM